MTTIEGQPSLFIQDLTGKEYPAIAEVNRKKRVNGQREISLSFLYDEINEDFIHDIEFGWKIYFKGEWYTITTPTYQLDGDRFSVGVSAVLSFFVDMNGHYLQDEAEDKSMTAANFFRDLFEGTGYSYVIVDQLSANTLNYQANQSKTERFLYGIDRFEAEYMIRGKVAYIYSLVGSDKDVILHEDLNIQDVSVEVDGSGFHTWAKGFGDKDDNDSDSDYKLEVEYVSPLVDKYGYIEGPAIRDGNYKHANALTEAVKNQVENSYKVSTTVTAVDLSNNGYPEMQLEEGDRLFLYVDRLKLNSQVRVVEIDETFDWEGNIIDVSYTLGNEGIAERYKTEQYNSLRDFGDIIKGRRKLKYNWLPEVVQRASDIINGNLTSHFHYGIGEIIGINTDNPNGYMRFNTDGLGFSRDGGKTYRTAITYEGIVADAITAGTLSSVLIVADNGDMVMDLVKGTFDIYRNGSIRFHNSAGGVRRIQNERSAILSFPVSAGSTTPMAAIGVVNQTGTINVNDSSFRGIRIHGDNVSHTNDLINDTWTFSRRIDQSQGSILVNLGAGKKGIFPQYTGSYNYDLGSANNRWDTIHANRIQSPTFYISNPVGLGGWYFDTQPEAGGIAMTFRGINSGLTDYVYNLGTSVNPFNFGRINHLRPTGSSHSIGASGSPYNYVYTNSLVEGSDERIKEEIFENILGLEFINDLDTVEFKMLETGQYKTGLIAQELAIVLETHGIELGKQSMVTTEDDVMGIAYTQLIAPIIKAVQELTERLEVLEGGTTETN